MGPFDIAVIVIVAVAFVAVIATVIYKKVRHKGGGCDCGCEGCTLCDKCKTNKK